MNITEMNRPTLERLRQELESYLSDFTNKIRNFGKDNTWQKEMANESNN